MTIDFSVSPDKLFRMPLKDILKRLDELETDNGFKKTEQHNKTFFNIISWAAPFFLNQDKPKLSVILYRRAQLQLTNAWREGFISYKEKHAFDVSLIIALNEAEKYHSAIFEAKRIISEYKNEYAQIRSECEDHEREQKSNPGCLPFIQLSFQDLCRYAKRISRNHGLNIDTSFFHYSEKLFQLYHLEKFVFDYSSSWKIRGQHKFVTEGDMPWITMETSPKSKRGFQKLSAYVHIFMKISISQLERCFWGYGERPKRLIYSMLASILGFGILYSQKNWINGANSVADCIYFSFVTFTNMGENSMTPLDQFLPRYTVAFESFVGVLFIALLIFVIGRKVTY